MEEALRIRLALLGPSHADGRGPRRLREHEHTLEEVERGTLIGDSARYAVPGGPLAGILHRFQVGPDLEEIVRNRRHRLAEILRARETAT